jgi:tRNA 2-thiouridine synthesizing protein A
MAGSYSLSWKQYRAASRRLWVPPPELVPAGPELHDTRDCETLCMASALTPATGRARTRTARRPNLEVTRVTPQHPPADTPPAASASAAPPRPELTIDALGRKCPIPIIMLAERIREVAIGQVVAVLADDPAAETDVPAWCMLKSQEFIMAADLPGDAEGWAFLVRRSY